MARGSKQKNPFEVCRKGKRNYLPMHFGNICISSTMDIATRGHKVSDPVITVFFCKIIQIDDGYGILFDYFTGNWKIGIKSLNSGIIWQKWSKIYVEMLRGWVEVWCRMHIFIPVKLVKAPPRLPNSTWPVPNLYFE